VAALGLGSYFVLQRLPTAPASVAATPFATRTVNGLTVNLYAPGGLRFAENEVTIEFLDAVSGQPADVGKVKFELNMDMPGMVMNSGATISPTGEPGRYLAKIKPDMAGDWTAKLDYDGQRGQGALSFTVTVTQ
jgi:hypothetical protein